MTQRVAVAKLSELPMGAKKRVVVHGREICLYHLSDGIYATDDVCTHERASLAAGELVRDSIIECPRHGSRFDIRTGENRSLPAVIPLQTYPLTITDDIISLDIASES